MLPTLARVDSAAQIESEPFAPEAPLLPLYKSYVGDSYDLAKFIEQECMLAPWNLTFNFKKARCGRHSARVPAHLHLRREGAGGVLWLHCPIGNPLGKKQVRAPVCPAGRFV